MFGNKAVGAVMEQFIITGVEGYAGVASRGQPKEGMAGNRESGKFFLYQAYIDVVDRVADDDLFCDQVILQKDIVVIGAVIEKRAVQGCIGLKKGIALRVLAIGDVFRAGV